MKRYFFIVLTLVAVAGVSAQTLRTNNPQLDSAFQLAVWTIDHNTHDGIIAAGAGYGGEWTRDASINCWNALSLLRPEVAEKTLWSVTEDSVRIGHQYWDKIIWTLAAWHHYEVTADTAYLRHAYACASQTMRELERQCFDTNYGLFMGPAVFQDGIEAYPEPIYDPKKWDDSFVLHHPHSDSIRCLSTNVVYYRAYRCLGQMADVLGMDSASKHYAGCAQVLGNQIRQHFHHYEACYLDYLIDHRGVHFSHQEGLGVSLALSSGLFSHEECRCLLRQVLLTRYGIPSVSPCFLRNSPEKPGRHNMMIWPHINAFYADACAVLGAEDAFYNEVGNIARLAMVNGQGNFYEIYTIDGEPSGGWQCGALWGKMEHQTWCATGYLRLWIDHIFGLRCDGSGELTFHPMGMRDGSECTLDGIPWHGAELTVTVRGRGPRQQVEWIGDKVDITLSE